MLALSAALLSLAAVSFTAAGQRWACGVTFALSLAACVLAWGGAIGPLVQLVLAMTAASLLVLILPARTALAKPLALGTACIGLVMLLGERLLS